MKKKSLSPVKMMPTKKTSKKRVSAVSSRLPWRGVEISGLETQTADYYLAIEKATPSTGQDMYILVNRKTRVIEMRGYALWLMVCAMQTQQQALGKTRTGEINGFSSPPTPDTRAAVVTPPPVT
jgi:hypothetical protein